MFLNCHSWFSFKYGVMKPEALLEEAARAGVRTLALTDIHCTAGIPDFVRIAERYALRPVAGIEFRQGPRLLYVGIAKNNDGFQQLNELLSPHLLDGEAIPERAPLLGSSVATRPAAHASGSARSDGADVFFIYPFSNAPQQLRSNERIGITPRDLTRLPFSPWAKRPQDLVALLTVTFRSKRDFNTHRLLRTVAKNTVVSMLPKDELAAPDECFRTEEEVKHIYRDFPFLIRNAEELLEQCGIAFDGSDKTRKVFGTNEALDRERFHRDTLEGLRYRYPNASAKVIARMHHELDVIERMGFISYFLINQDIVRYARNRGFFHVGRGSGANSLVAYCLGITDVDPIELDLYFERFISTARKKPPDFDIDFSWKDRDEVYRYVFAKYNGPVGSARGSSASGIHAAQIATYTTFQWRGAIRELGKAVGLPPSEIDALSEGESNYYRDQRRVPDGAKGELDQVARTVIRYGQYVLGMPHHLGIHAGGILVSEKPLTYYTALHRPPKGFPVTQFSMLEAEDLGLHKFDLLSQRGLGHIRDAVEMVNQAPRYKTQDASFKGEENVQWSIPNAQCSSGHAQKGAGSADVVNEASRYKTQVTSFKGEENVQCATADIQCASGHAQNGPRSTDVAERAHSVEACDLSLVSCVFREAVDIHDIPRFKADPAIKELLRTGNTIGCFYVESPAMRMLLKKLKVDDYPGLVAASSIIRPGVAESGMMREYILRHNDPERRKQAVPELLRIMPETYGVMVYQEDVLRVAHHYAGLDMEEADTLRRGMTARFRERPEFKVMEEKYFANCKAKGHPDAEAAEIWRQIESFASFSFAKGHSASYAVESYQSLYLKAHHPLEFLVGVANNFGGFYHTEFYLHEAKRAGAVIEAPCVNTSEDLCSLRRVVSDERKVMNAASDKQHSPLSTHKSPLLFLGLGNVKSLNSEVVASILDERDRNGPYNDLPDLLRRVPLPVEQARILVRVGALRFTGRCKPLLLWDLALMHHGARDASPIGDLFVTKVEAPVLPDLEHYPLAHAYDELDLLGFPLCDPFTLVHGEEEVPRAPRILKRDMHQYKGKRVTVLGYMIHVKATDTHTGQRMTFGSFIDTAGDFWDSTQFPDTAMRFPFRGRGVYRLTGYVEEEFGHVSLRTQFMEKLPWRPDPRYGDK